MAADPRIVGYLKQYGQRFSPEQLVRSLKADGWPEPEIQAHGYPQRCASCL